MAEPALNALGTTVEAVTVGLSVGIAKVMFDIPMEVLIIPPYLLLIVLTLISDEKYVNIGWDSAGVTTGPITVPLVLAMGLAIGGAVGVADGVGMLAMASIGPILSALLVGIYVSRFGKVEEAATLWLPLDDEDEELPAVVEA